MTCVMCQTSNAPHELRDGKCLGCLHQENQRLRGIILQFLEEQGHASFMIPVDKPVTEEFVRSWQEALRERAAQESLM
jgi:hypothetical protein